MNYKHSVIWHKINDCIHLNEQSKKLALMDIEAMEHNKDYAKLACFNSQTSDLSKAFIWQKTMFISCSRTWLRIFDILVLVETLQKINADEKILPDYIDNKKLVNH